MRTKDEKKKQAIIEQTLNLVMEEGIAGISMAKLAKRTKLSPGTLYLYYKNKEDLIISIYTDLFNNNSASVNDLMALDLPYKERFKKVWLHWLNHNVTNYKALNFHNQVRQSPFLHKIPEQLKKDKGELSHKLFDEGKQKEILKDVDNILLTSVLASMLSQAASLITRKKYSLQEEDTDLLFSFLWDSIKR